MENKVNSVGFVSLSPKNNSEIKIYRDALDYALSQEDICNIALTGPYGSGKSSVIETYKRVKQTEQSDQEKFIHISLTKFSEIGVGHTLSIEDRESLSLVKLNNSDDEFTLKEFEAKILNQILHQIEDFRIPQTNFKIKREIDENSIKLIAFNLVLMVILGWIVFYFKSWVEFVGQLSSSIGSVSPLLNFFQLPFFKLCVLFLFFYLVYRFIYDLVFEHKVHGILKKISLHGTEVELFNDKNESFFDKYLNEVLYLFEHAGASIFVFEDIDRFNSINIFQRLREINTLLNVRRKSASSKIRFIYLIRDDLFSSKDRTKFFDFIIPVVPVIDGSNSYEQIKKLFNCNDGNTKFNDRFLKEISYFIDDMRVLKNVWNEYLIYEARIADTEQNPNKLLAMLIYKNLFPKDFSETHIGTGFIATLFKNKLQWINDAKPILEGKRSELLKELTLLDNCLQISQEEAKLLINSYYRSPLAKADVNKRLTSIIDKNGDYRTELEQQINEITEQIIFLDKSQLKDIIEKSDSGKVFEATYKNDLNEEKSFKDVKRSSYFPLLKLLIRKGYIDESYSDYMTYFYPGTLTRKDMVFIRSIAENEFKGESYKLNFPLAVIEELEVTDFKVDAVLNFDLAECLVANREVFKEKNKFFFRHLESFSGVEFVVNYLAQKRVPKEFLFNLFEVCPCYVQSILKFHDLYQGTIRHFIYSVFEFLDIEEIKNINQEMVLTEWISNSEEFLNTEFVDSDKFVSILESLEVKFELINLSGSNEILWRKVYENNLYKLTSEMISRILQRKNPKLDKDAIKYCNLSLIRQYSKQHLINYVNSNFSNYFDLMLEMGAGNICNYPDTTIHVLNREDLSDVQKIKYIENLSTKIDKIEMIEKVKSNNLKQKLFVKGVVDFSFKNAACYFSILGGKMTPAVIAFVEQINMEITVSDVHKIDEVLVKPGLGLSFAKALQVNNLITADQYKRIETSITSIK